MRRFKNLSSVKLKGKSFSSKNIHYKDSADRHEFIEGIKRIYFAEDREVARMTTAYFSK